MRMKKKKYGNERLNLLGELLVTDIDEFVKNKDEIYDEKNPLTECFEMDRKFFELFVDFKGYVDYFFLQDCVSADYSSVLFWLDSSIFKNIFIMIFEPTFILS